MRHIFERRLGQRFTGGFVKQSHEAITILKRLIKGGFIALPSSQLSKSVASEREMKIFDPLKEVFSGNKCNVDVDRLI